MRCKYLQIETVHRSTWRMECPFWTELWMLRQLAARWTLFGLGAYWNHILDVVLTIRTVQTGRMLFECRWFGQFLWKHWRLFGFFDRLELRWMLLVCFDHTRCIRAKKRQKLFKINIIRPGFICMIFTIFLVIVGAIAHFLLQRQLSLSFNFSNIVHGQSVPFVLPGPCLPMRSHHCLSQCRVVYEFLQFRLHAPITEFDATQFVCAHERHIRWRWLRLISHLVPIFGDPTIAQWTTICLLRNEQRGIFLFDIIGSVQLIFDDVNNIWEWKWMEREFCFSFAFSWFPCRTYQRCDYVNHYHLNWTHYLGVHRRENNTFQFPMKISQQMDMYNGFWCTDMHSMLLLQRSMHFWVKVLRVYKEKRKKEQRERLATGKKRSKKKRNINFILKRFVNSHVPFIQPGKWLPTW